MRDVLRRCGSLVRVGDFKEMLFALGKGSVSEREGGRKSDGALASA